MYVDCHGHFTTVPAAVKEWRDRQIRNLTERGEHITDRPIIGDQELREAIETAQLRVQKQRGVDVTLFSPIAGWMGHHVGDLSTSLAWSRICNDLIARVCSLFPESFVGVCQLPQSPGASIDACVAELERCVEQLGFVGCNLNPDLSGGFWQTTPLSDEFYYPLYEKMIELNVPAMIHASASCNVAVQGTCAHYLNADTTVFMQVCSSDLFTRLPDLKLIIPHGGGAVPYHWGRYRGVLQDMGRGELRDIIRGNVFFDTCVYWKRGLELLVDTVPVENVLFASEMMGAVRGIDLETGRHYDDTRFLLDSITSLGGGQRADIAAGNALRVFGRLGDVLRSRGCSVSGATAGD